MFKNTTTTDMMVFYAGAIGTILVALYGPGGWWWALALAVHVTVISIFSAIIHRYYCHDAFKANPTVAFALSLVSTAYFYSSAVQWRVMHLCHHAYSDTPKDTHTTGLKGFFGKGYTAPEARFFKTGIRLMRDEKQAFVHEYAVLFGLGWGALLLAINVNLFMYAFIVPIFTNHLANRVHKQFGHDGKGGSEHWWMEFICPMGGEWLHRDHHINAGRSIFSRKWYHFDPGSVIVRAIRQQ